VDTPRYLIFAPPPPLKQVEFFPNRIPDDESAVGSLSPTLRSIINVLARLVYGASGILICSLVSHRDCSTFGQDFRTRDAKQNDELADITATSCSISARAIPIKKDDGCGAPE